MKARRSERGERAARLPVAPVDRAPKRELEGGRAADRAEYYVDSTRFGNIVDKRDLYSVLFSKEEASSEDSALRQRQQDTKGKHETPQYASSSLGRVKSLGGEGRDDVI